jgi:Flp pilus assembly CpaF family ATPase
MLRTALGPLTAGYLEDPGIVEVMLDPEGRLWIDRLSGGLEDTGCRVALDPALEPFSVAAVVHGRKAENCPHSIALRGRGSRLVATASRRGVAGGDPVPSDAGATDCSPTG